MRRFSSFQPPATLATSKVERGVPAEPRPPVGRALAHVIPRPATAARQVVFSFVMSLYRLSPYAAALAFCLAVFTATALAQSIRWEPASGTLAAGQTSELQLIFEGCASKGDPVIPVVDGLTLQRIGQSSQTSIINGTVNRSETLTYTARPTQKTDVAIPEFSVTTDKGKLAVPAATFSVGEASIGGVSLESIATSRFGTPASVWAGEVFPLDYTLNIRRRNAHSLGGELEWKPAPLSVEDWSKAEKRDTLVAGENYVALTQKTRATLRTPGTATINSANQLVNIVKGVDMWGRPNLDQFTITSNHPAIEVRPLPASAPASFNGAVGIFTLKSNVVPATASVGEPITWTLTLAGTGNWPDLAGLPARSVSKDFRTIQPQAKRTPKDGTLFDATLIEDVVLIPTKPGTYSLGPTTWSYFDPVKGEYKTVNTAAVTVTVTHAPETVPTATANLSSTTATASKSESGNRNALPAAIPRDALPDDGDASTPLTPSTYLFARLAPLAALIAFWFWLALRRARRTDPLVPRREARQRLAATLAALRSPQTPAATAELLLSWQKDTALLWQIAQAVPATTSFPVTETAWIALWAEAERALYRDATPLPTDWVDRAETALTAKPVRAFSSLQLFRLRNLLPFAALLALGLLAPASTLLAADGRNAYERGDFPAAEQTWRKALATAPANPATHHNLSLSLAQQNRWSEAAAHAAAAFTQEPRNPAIRWNLAFTLERAGYAPSVFSGFVNSHPPHLLARQLSSPEWQVAAILALTLSALGGALLLLRAYGQRGQAMKVTAAILLILAALLGGAATVSLRVYSPLNDARAAIVWRTTTLRSIPTEADSTQKTTPLAAGTVAVIDRVFISGDRWVHLSFSNGQTGWTRPEDLVKLWQ